MTQEHVLQMFIVSLTQQVMSKKLLGFILTPLKLLTNYSPYRCKAGLKFRHWLCHESIFCLINTVSFLSVSWQLMFLTGCGAVVLNTLPSAADLAEVETVICWCWQSLSAAAAGLTSASSFSMAEQGQKIRGSYSQADTSISHCAHLANNSITENYALVNK